MLPFAILAMCLALTFYTIGVFGERKAKSLELKHVIFFGLGLACDSTGTSLMKSLMGSSLPQAMADIHIVTGAAALILMLAHFLWAVFTYFKGSPKAKENFHKFSIVVWVFWLIPFIIGMIIGMIH